jgi:hypothetical protein
VSTADEIYTSLVQGLPPAERLRLAALILHELAQPDIFSPDVSGAWSEEDEHDLASFSMRHGEVVYPRKDDTYNRERE